MACDQELVRRGTGGRRDQGDLGGGRADFTGQVTHAQDVEHAVLEASAGRFLEHELGLAAQHGLAVDPRQVRGSNDANARGGRAETTARTQAPEADSVVRAHSELVDFDAVQGEFGARDQDE